MNIDAALARAQRDYAALPEWQQTATGGGMKPPECIHDSERRDLARKFIVCPLCLSERMAHLEAENDALWQEREALKDWQNTITAILCIAHPGGVRYDEAATLLKADIEILALARAVLDTAIEHTDEFGAVTVRVEPLAYDAWQRWQESRRD